MLIKKIYIFQNNPLFLVIYYTIILVYDTFCAISNHHLVHNILLSIFFFFLILFRNMYKNFKNKRPHGFWCLQEPLMMCSLYKNKYM